MKRIVSIFLVLVLVLTAIPLVSMAISQYGYVTGGWLRLRSSPSFSASTISSYYTGTSVKILGTSGSWYQVEAPDGNTGYMESPASKPLAALSTYPSTPVICPAKYSPGRLRT